jgi:hypothetical protein
MRIRELIGDRETARRTGLAGRSLWKKCFGPSLRVAALFYSYSSAIRGFHGQQALIAASLVGSVKRGSAVWIRRFSQEAVRDWTQPIDFLFIDGNQRHEAVRSDWELWTPMVVASGRVALHDAVVNAELGISADDGPVRVVGDVASQGTWHVTHQVDAGGAPAARKTEWETWT